MDAQGLFISSQQTKRHVISVTGEPSMAHGVLSMATSAGCIRWVYSNFRECFRCPHPRGSCSSISYGRSVVMGASSMFDRNLCVPLARYSGDQCSAPKGIRSQRLTSAEHSRLTLGRRSK